MFYYLGFPLNNTVVTVTPCQIEDQFMYNGFETKCTVCSTPTSHGFTAIFTLCFPFYVIIDKGSWSFSESLKRTIGNNKQCLKTKQIG